MLLDDVMSELDGRRRRALVDLLRSGGGQAVITATDADQVPGADEPDVHRLEVAAGRSPGRDGGRLMTYYRRAPRSMQFALDELADELAPATVLADVQRAWPATVGPAIAAQAQPTAERGGVVTVSCAASVWAQELDLMAPQIIRAAQRRRSTAARFRGCAAWPSDTSA